MQAPVQEINVPMGSTDEQNANMITVENMTELTSSALSSITKNNPYSNVTHSGVHDNSLFYGKCSPESQQAGRESRRTGHKQPRERGEIGGMSARRDQREERRQTKRKGRKKRPELGGSELTFDSLGMDYNISIVLAG